MDAIAASSSATIALARGISYGGTMLNEWSDRVDDSDTRQRTGRAPWLGIASALVMLVLLLGGVSYLFG